MPKKPRRGPGRPPVDPKRRARRASFSLHPSQITFLEAEAKRLGVSVSRILQKIIETHMPAARSTGSRK